MRAVITAAISSSVCCCSAASDHRQRVKVLTLLSVPEVSVAVRVTLSLPPLGAAMAAVPSFCTVTRAVLLLSQAMATVFFSPFTVVAMLDGSITLVVQTSSLPSLSSSISSSVIVTASMPLIW